MRKMWLNRLASSSGAALLLASCASLTQTSAPTEADGATKPLRPELCRLTPALTWSPKDTDATIAEIKTFDAVWHSECGV